MVGGRWGTVCLGLALSVWGVVLAQSEAPVVVINELAWAGSSLSPSDEWIELLNTTESEIDISGWQLTKRVSGNETEMLTLPAGSKIPGNGYFLISNFGVDNSVLNIEPNLVDTAVALANSSLEIKLYNGDFESGGTLIDIAGDGGTPPAGSNSLKISMERTNDFAGWQDASTAVNLDEGVNDLGTPGAENSVPLLPPTLTSINPNVAMNDVTLEVEEIVGTNFHVNPAPTIKLKLGSEEIVASNVNVASPTLIDQAHFNVEGAEVGEWDLVLINANDQTATLVAAVTISEPEVEPDLSTTIRISEIYPRPNSTSNDEFIELYNFGEKAVNLTGWQLDDIPNGGSLPYVFKDTSIPPKSFLTLYKPTTKLTLNDVGDSVLLTQPNGFVLDEISYESATKGQSLARFDNGWFWTETVTPNGANVLTQTPEEEEEELEEEEEVEEESSETEPAKLLITELFPNPTDGEEFIEIYNPTNSKVVLTGWRLRDASGKTFTIGEKDMKTQGDTSIPPGQFVYFLQSTSKLQLNNTGGETVELISPGGVVVAAVSYPDRAPSDASYAHYEESSWTWTETPTPGKPNLIVLDEPPTTSAATTVVTGKGLPEAGMPARQWWGLLLMSLSLASMLVWYKQNHEINHH